MNVALQVVLSLLSSTVAELVAAHASAVDSLYSFDVTINLHVRLDSGIDWRTPHAMWRFSKLGATERIRYRAGNLRVFYDQLRTEKEERWLQDWDPDDPPALSLENQHGVMAALGPRTNEIPNWANAAAQVLLKFQFGAESGSSDLREIQASSLFHTTLIEENGIQGLRITREPISGWQEGSYCDVYFEPTANFLVGRVESHQVTNNQASDGTATVTKWYREGANVFPERIEHRFLKAEEPHAVSEVQVGVINQELPADALDFRFPENAIVLNLPTVASHAPITLWGADNKPVRTIDPDELTSPDGEGQPQEGNALGLNRWILISVNLAVIAAIFLWSRRRRVRRDHAEGR